MKQGLHLSYELVDNLSQSIQFAFNPILGKENSFKEDIYCLQGNETEKLYKVM